MTSYPITILSGDFEKGQNGDFSSNELHLSPIGSAIRETIKVSDIQSFEDKTDDPGETTTAILLSLLGFWGFLVFVIKSFFEGSKETSFICVMKDGRKLVATIPSKGYWAIHDAFMATRGI